jgi:hypothetical protein
MDNPSLDDQPANADMLLTKGQQMESSLPQSMMVEDSGREARVDSLTVMCQKSVGRYLANKYGANFGAMRTRLVRDRIPTHLISGILRHAAVRAQQIQGQKVVAKAPGSCKLM